MKFYGRMYANKCKGACKVVHVRIGAKGEMKRIKNRLHNSFKREKNYRFFMKHFLKRFSKYIYVNCLTFFLINNNPKIS